jgi:hypothetical protein
MSYPAVAGDDEQPHVLVGLGGRERLPKLVLHAHGDGVQLVWPVEANRRDAVLDAVGDRLEVMARASA